MHDLQTVSIHHRSLSPSGARSDRTLVFHRNAVATQTKRINQPLQRHWRGQPLDASRLPIHLYL